MGPFIRCLVPENKMSAEIEIEAEEIKSLDDFKRNVYPEMRPLFLEISVSQNSNFSQDYFAWMTEIIDEE